MVSHSFEERKKERDRHILLTTSIIKFPSIFIDNRYRFQSLEQARIFENFSREIEARERERRRRRERTERKSRGGGNELFGFRLSPFGRSVEWVPRPSFVRGQTLERVEETAEPRERERKSERRSEEGARGEGGGRPPSLPAPHNAA